MESKRFINLKRVSAVIVAGLSLVACTANEQSSPIAIDSNAIIDTTPSPELDNQIICDTSNDENQASILMFTEPGKDASNKGLIPEDIELYTRWGVSVMDIATLEDAEPCETICVVSKKRGPEYEFTASEEPKTLGERYPTAEQTVRNDIIIEGILDYVPFEFVDKWYIYPDSVGLMKYASGSWSSFMRAFVGECPPLNPDNVFEEPEFEMPTTIPEDYTPIVTIPLETYPKVTINDWPPEVEPIHEPKPPENEVVVDQTTTTTSIYIG